MPCWSVCTDLKTPRGLSIIAIPLTGLSAETVEGVELLFVWCTGFHSYEILHSIAPLPCWGAISITAPPREGHQ